MGPRALALVLAVIGAAGCDPAIEEFDRASNGTTEPPGGEAPPEGTPASPDAPRQPKVTRPLVAFTGGASIALRWSTIGTDAKGVTEYAVYRDGKPIASVKPGFHPEFPEKDGKGYIDKDIQPGVSGEATTSAA